MFQNDRATGERERVRGGERKRDKESLKTTSARKPKEFLI
jgi:hypothetical protein